MASNTSVEKKKLNITGKGNDQSKSNVSAEKKLTQPPHLGPKLQESIRNAKPRNEGDASSSHQEDGQCEELYKLKKICWFGNKCPRENVHLIMKVLSHLLTVVMDYDANYGEV